MSYARDPVHRPPLLGSIWLGASTLTASAAMPDYEYLLNLFLTQSIDGFFFMTLDRPLDWQGAADQSVALEYALQHQRLTRANEAFFRQYLIQAEDWLGRPFAEFFRHDPDSGRTLLSTLFDQGQLCVTTEERRADGSCVWIEGAYVCLHDHKGQITGFFGIQRDVTDYKQALLTLQMSQQRIQQQDRGLQAVLESAQTGIWEWHIPSNQVIWTESLERMMGMKPGEFDGRMETVQALIYPEDRDLVAQALQQALQGTAGYQQEFRFVRADGSVRWAYGKGEVQRDDQGQPMLMRGVDVDITDRKEAELQLRESEVRFHNVSRNLPGAIFRYVLHADQTDSVTYMNPGCREIWELEPEAVIEDASRLWDMVHPDDREGMWQLVLQSAETLEPWFYEWRITTPSRKQKWLQGVGRPNRLPSGDVAWDTLILDMSDRRQMELELAQTSAQLESFIANTPALVTLIDSDGRYLKVNQATADQFRCRAEDVTGRHISEFIPARLVPFFLQRIRQVIDTQRPMTVEDRLPLPTGNKVFSTVMFPIVSATGEHQRAIGCIATEITPLVDAQVASRRQAQEERLLRTITQHIHQSLDVHEVLQTAVTEVRQFLQTDRVVVYRFNPDFSGQVVVESVQAEWMPILGETIKDTCFMTNPAVVEQYHQGRISAVNDITQAALTPCHRGLLQRFQVQANLVIPIVYDGKLWGLLCIHHCRSSRRWHNTEISLVGQLAEQLAIALYQGQLLDQTTLMAQQEKLLNDIVTAISDSLDLDDLLHRAAEEMLQVFQASRGSVILCQPADATFTHATSVVAPGVQTIENQHVPIEGNPHAQAILMQDQPVAVDDVAQDPLMAPMRSLAEAREIRAMLAVSIRYRGEVKGILSLHQCHQPRHWSQAEKNLIKRVADHLAIAIQQAELYEQAQAELAARKQLESKLRYDALHDKLTALPNRTFFLERLSAAIEQLHRNGLAYPACSLPHNPKQPTPDDHQFAVLFLDLDRFKVINDSLGHTIGDLLLQTVAQRLKTCLRPMDTAARLGGDEFVVLMTNLADAQVATTLAQRIHNALEAPIWLEGYEVFVRASIGITLGSPAYTDPNHVLRDADIAMYQAKASNREYAIFDTPMHALAVQQMRMENDLRRAIERQEFTLHYQPIVNLATAQVQGFEALMRWQHPTVGTISPVDFIPVAENTGLITTLDLWALNQACQQLRQWQQQYPRLNLFVNVNLSGKQFMRPDLLTQIDQALASNSLSGKSLKIEITESVLIQNSQAAIDLLRQLRHRRIQICMDDFGTGYSSLSYLHRFPIDVLKIDKTFIASLQMDSHRRDDNAIVRAILSLANGLNLAVVAEGVETPEQVQYLRTHHCQSAQGYFFSKPLPAKDITNLLTHQPLRPMSPPPAIL